MRDHWDTMGKKHEFGVLKEKRFMPKAWQIFFSKVIGENCPNLGKDTLIQTQETHRTPNRTREETTHHIIVKIMNI